jgi:hypothetical protein
MAGIAVAESGGNAGVLNDTPSTGDYSVGLWQINYYDGLLSGRTAEYGSPAALAADPNAQAKAAIALFGGGPGISNWKGDATYNAWQAAGAPQQPSSAAVSGWLGGKDTTGAGTAVPETSGATSTGNTGASGSGSACTLNILGACILSASELKAIRGGLLLVAGGIVMGLGTFEMVMTALKGTQAGRQVAKGPAAKAVRTIVKRSPARFVPGSQKLAAGTAAARGKSSSASNVRTTAAKPATPSFGAKDLNAAFDAGRGTGAAQGPSDAQRARWQRQGFAGEGAAKRNAPATPGKVRQLRQPPARPARKEAA